MRAGLVVPLLLLAFAAPVAAQQDGPELTATAKVAKAKRPRLICKTDADLGTRIAKRTCLTWDEWRKRDDATSDAARRFLDQASGQASAAGAASAGAGPSGR